MADLRVEKTLGHGQAQPVHWEHSQLFAPRKPAAGPLERQPDVDVFEGSNKKAKPEQKSFWNSWLWQGLKIGVPVALGFLFPMGFLAATVTAGATMGGMTLVEKLATKGHLDKADGVDIAVDFGMGFLGGWIAKAKVFQGATSYARALVKGLMGGATSGAAAGGVGRVLKDGINEGTVHSEHVVQDLAMGALAGGALGGALGTLGHHLHGRTNAGAKPVLEAEQPIQPDSGLKVYSGGRAAPLESGRPAAPRPAEKPTPPPSGKGPLQPQAEELPMAELEPAKPVRSRFRTTNLQKATPEAQTLASEIEAMRAKLAGMDASQYAQYKHLRHRLDSMVYKASQAKCFDLATQADDLRIALNEGIHVDKIPKLTSSTRQSNLLEVLDKRKDWSIEFLLDAETHARKIHIDQIPDDPKGIVNWARKLRRFSTHLERQAKQYSLDDSQIHEIGKLTNSNPLSNRLAYKVMNQNAGAYVAKPEDLQPNSYLKQQMAATFKAIYILEKRMPHFDEMLLLYSRPKKLLSAPQTDAKPNKPFDKLKGLLKRKPNTSDQFMRQMEDGIDTLPVRAQKWLKRMGNKFIAKHHTRQGSEKDLVGVPRGYPEGTTFDHAGGVAIMDKGEMIVSEFVRDHTGTNWVPRSRLVRDTVLHEGGHGLDRSLHFATQLRKLNRATTMEEFNRILQESRSQNLDTRMYSHSKTFQKAYMKDYARLKKELSPVEWDQLAYFTQTDAEGKLLPGMEEAFAEAVTGLYSERASVNYGNFRNVMELVRKKFQSHFGFKGIAPGQFDIFVD